MLRNPFTRRPSIEFTDQGVTRHLGIGGVESVTWDELLEVRILTTSDGPFAEDVFFVLDAGEHGCVVPQGHAPEEFVTRLMSLPGFDNEQMIQAMGSTTEAEFVCWRRGK